MTTSPSAIVVSPEAEVIQQEWLQDLRSGGIKQCVGALSKDGGLCCLGVLAAGLRDRHPDWLAENGFEVAPVTSSAFGDLAVTDIQLSVHTDTGLPARLAQLVGLPADPDAPDGHRKYVTEVEIGLGAGGAGRSLAGLNDSGHSFTEIAIVIEELLGTGTSA